jgi:hypothetical protein
MFCDPGAATVSATSEWGRHGDPTGGDGERDGQQAGQDAIRMSVASSLHRARR